MSISNRCHDQRCILLYFEDDFNLLPNQILQITTQVRIALPDGYLFEIKNHVHHRFWQIGNKFLVPDATHQLTIPIVTAQNAVTIKAGLPFCHLQIITPTQAYNRIEGTTLLYMLFF